MKTKSCLTKVLCFILGFALLSTSAPIAAASNNIADTVTLTLNVTNQNGLPAADWTWVDIYDITGQYQIASGYLVGGTKVFSYLAVGTYHTIVSSGSDHFQITATTNLTSDTVLNLDARVETVTITLTATGRDGTPLLGAYFAVAPQAIPWVSGGIGSGEMDGDGELIATVTPGTLIIAALDRTRLYRLDLPNQVINTNTSVVLDGSVMPTGQFDVTLDGAPSGSFRINRDPNIGTDLSIASTATIVVSTGSTPADLELHKTGAADHSWYLGLTLPGSPFTVTNGSVTAITGGGNLTAALAAAPVYLRGAAVNLSRTFRDAHNNSLNYLGYTQEYDNINVPVSLTVRDSSDQVIYQNEVDVRDGTSSFAIPITAAFGTATATLSVDTGPFQGMLTTSTSFEIIQNYRISLPAIFRQPSVSPCPAIPTLVSPANGSSLSTLNPLFTWDNGSNPNATTLRLSIAYDVAFTHLYSDLYTGAYPGISDFRFADNLAPATTYYWRAWLMCGQDQGAYSPVWSFTSGSGGAILAAPASIAPANGSTSPRPVTFQWTAVPGAVDYILHWRPAGQGGGFSYTWVDVTQISISWLDPSTHYEWWVSARNDFAIGTDSDIWHFFTSSADLPMPSLGSTNHITVVDKAGVNQTLIENQNK
jgi:hypothetical protein